MFFVDVLKHIFLALLILNVLGEEILAIDHHGNERPSNHTVEEAFEVLGISWNPDGSLNRKPLIPVVNATPHINWTQPPPIALSKDIYIHPSSNESGMIRLFRPLKLPRNARVPLVINFHGGDFVLFNVSTIIFHDFCNQIASQIPAVVASVEYRHAPEHRLPAAYKDAVNAILWAKHQAMRTYGQDPWLNNVDFTRVFLLGSGAGGNIVYHAALHTMGLDLEPMKIQGVFMNQPYFGGIRRTKSELRLVEDPFVPLYVNDVLWTLALPKYANRDHIFCNPLNSYFGKMKKFPKCMVKGNTGDPLVDRGRKLVKLLKSNGVRVVSTIVEGGSHGIELVNATAAQELYHLIRNFIHSI